MKTSHEECNARVHKWVHLFEILEHAKLTYSDRKLGDSLGNDCNRGHSGIMKAYSVLEEWITPVDAFVKTH